MFVQDPTLFTGLFSTESQKSDCSPSLWSGLTLWRKDVQVDIWLTVGAGVGVSTQSLPILVTDCTHQDKVTMEMLFRFDYLTPPAPPPHIQTPPPLISSAQQLLPVRSRHQLHSNLTLIITNDKYHSSNPPLKAGW